MSTTTRYHHGDLPRALLDALPDLILEEGLDRLSLRALARRAGVTHGAPAHHFGDKRGLLTAFAIEGAHHLADCVENALREADPQHHPARLTAVGLGYLDFALEYPAHFRVTFRPEWLDTANGDLMTARARAGGTLDAVLEAARTAGWLRAEDYAAVRMASWSLAHGYASLAAEVFAGQPAEALRAQAQHAFDHFCTNMLPAPGHAQVSPSLPVEKNS